jgi:LysM repeat protein
MSDSGDDNKRGQDPKKVALALATLPITIIGSIIPTDDVANASEIQNLNPDDSVPSRAEQGETANPPTRSLARQSVYQVVRGDTVSSIAKKFSLTSRELMRINDLTESSLIMPGQVLRLVDNAVQPSVVDKVIGAVQHKVKSGETLAQIANRYSIKLPTLLALNQLQERSLIFPGQLLTVRAVNPSTTAQPSISAGEHIVQGGETLTQIAKRLGISLASLLKANKGYQTYSPVLATPS